MLWKILYRVICSGIKFVRNQLPRSRKIDVSQVYPLEVLNNRKTRLYYRRGNMPLPFKVYILSMEITNEIAHFTQSKFHRYYKLNLIITTN